jgi:hypothetical protein
MDKLTGSGLQRSENSETFIILTVPSTTVGSTTQPDFVCHVMSNSESTVFPFEDVMTLVHVMIEEPDLRGQVLTGRHVEHVHGVAASGIQTLPRLLRMGK